MNKINLRKYIIIVFCVVITFCFVAGIAAWVLLKDSNSGFVESVNKTDKSNVSNQGEVSMPAKNNDLQVNNNDAFTNKSTTAKINGQINVKQINNFIKEQKYTLMVKGIFDKGKVNKFLNNNISSLISNDCSMISYKLVDLNNDGFDEIGIMYEKSVGSNSYLMVSALRWVEGQVIKDIDTEMRVNDYDNNVEIAAGDIITGGNAEFSFIQKDSTGKKGSKIKIALLLNEGFKEFINLDAVYEIEVGDFDGDGGLELYTSNISADGTKNMSWSKWKGTRFVEYQSNQQSTPENMLQQQSY
jgi:hypothetical protein